VQQPPVTELGTVSGQLRAPSGTLVPGLRVFAMPVEPDAGVGTLVSITEADGQGRYRLEDVPPGRYVIAAGLLNSPTYYPGVANRNQAQVVTIAAGQAITNLDIAFTFLNVPPELRGRVEFDDGTPLPVGTLQGIRLILSSDRLHWTTQPFTNQQGFFFFQSVVPGEYFFTLAPLPLGYGYPKSLTFGNVDLTRAPVRVTEALNTTEIKVVLTKTRPAGLPPGVKVSGRVTNWTIVPLTLNALTQVIDRVRPEEVANPVAYVTPRADGSFEFEGVPRGRYMLAPRGGKALVTLDVAGSDVTGLDFDFGASPNNPRSKFPVVLSANSTKSIAGTVDVGSGTIPKFELVFSPTRVDKTPHTAVVSGKDFTVTLPEGEYRVKISGLPDGYIVESVTAGPLDLTYPFLVTSKGIADRFTGNPILIRSAGSPAVSAGITVRLKAP
jgi:hypothetical protein